MGPGGIPVRVLRQGNQLFVSEARDAPLLNAGTIPPSQLEGFPLVDGQVNYVTFDHEIRYFKAGKYLKRHYTASIKFWDPTLTQITAYYADAIQPRELYELGYRSGIVDLQHVYPMGRTLHTNSRGQTSVRVYAGVSDAHTAQYDFDLVRLLSEMGTGSASRRASGQVYTPH